MIHVNNVLNSRTVLSNWSYKSNLNFTRIRAHVKQGALIDIRAKTCRRFVVARNYRTPGTKDDALAPIPEAEKDRTNVRVLQIVRLARL